MEKERGKVWEYNGGDELIQSTLFASKESSQKIPYYY
jgi:hypothetical protein